MIQGMKSIILLIVSAAFVFVACTTATIPPSTEQPVSISTIPPVPTATLQKDRTIWFQDNFDSKSLNAKWNVLEGQPKTEGGLATGKEKVTLQINDLYPSDFTVQFDINHCGNDGYFLLTFANELQFELLADGSTNQRIYQNNQWMELPSGRFHRCAGHIAIIIKSESYIVLNVHKDEVVKILEGKSNKRLNGPIKLTVTPYGFVDNFLVTSP